VGEGLNDFVRLPDDMIVRIRLGAGSCETGREIAMQKFNSLTETLSNADPDLKCGGFGELFGVCSIQVGGWYWDRTSATHPQT